MIKNLLIAVACFIGCVPISYLLVKFNLINTERKPEKVPQVKSAPKKRRERKYSIALEGAKEEAFTYTDTRV